MAIAETEVSFLRQLDWFDPERVNASVTIVGNGGIGSFAALALAKLGVQQISLVDFDHVEDHNFPNQAFTPSQIGMSKVNALAETVQTYAPSADVQIHEQRLEDGVPLSDIVISALDSMDARALLWKAVKDKVACKRLIDGRLAGETIVVYAPLISDPADIEGYEATLHSDEEALEMPCTRQSIIDVGFSVASLITRAVRLHYAGMEVEKTVVMRQDTLQLVSGGWVEE
jgi:hypothetical protein